MISHYSGTNRNQLQKNSQLNISDISQDQTVKQTQKNTYGDKDYYLETSSKVDISLISSSNTPTTSNNNHTKNAFAIKHMSFSNLGHEVDQQSTLLARRDYQGNNVIYMEETSGTANQKTNSSFDRTINQPLRLRIANPSTLDETDTIQQYLKSGTTPAEKEQTQSSAAQSPAFLLNKQNVHGATSGSNFWS